MNIGEYVKDYLKKEGRTAMWVSEKLDINYKTLVGKINRNALSAIELLKISALLDMNLEDLKKELDISNLFLQAHEFVYAPILEDTTDIFSKSEFRVQKLELMNKKIKDKRVLINLLTDEFDSFDDLAKYKDIQIYAFTECKNQKGKYQLEKVSINYLKYVDPYENDNYNIITYMIKKPNEQDRYILKSELDTSIFQEKNIATPRTTSAPRNKTSIRTSSPLINSPSIRTSSAFWGQSTPRTSYAPKTFNYIIANKLK